MGLPGLVGCQVSGAGEWQGMGWGGLDASRKSKHLLDRVRECLLCDCGYWRTAASWHASFMSLETSQLTFTDFGIVPVAVVATAKIGARSPTDIQNKALSSDHHAVAQQPSNDNQITQKSAR